MRASTVAPATSISVSDSAVSRMIPLENTSRWPRRVSQWGRNESSATKLARNGKPVKLVLPPVNKTAAVAAWSAKNMACPAGVGPNTTAASWARMVGNPAVYGIAWLTCASQDPRDEERHDRPLRGQDLPGVAP